MKLLYALLFSLPEIVSLVKEIMMRIEKAEADRKVKDDLKAIKKAFETNDSELLNRVMRGLPND